MDLRVHLDPRGMYKNADHLSDGTSDNLEEYLKDIMYN